jgi:hypothetical protein
MKWHEVDIKHIKDEHEVKKRGGGGKASMYTIEANE